MTKQKFHLLVWKELVAGRCGCLFVGNRMNICATHAPREVLEQLTAPTN